MIRRREEGMTKEAEEAETEVLEEDALVELVEEGEEEVEVEAAPEEGTSESDWDSD